MARVNSVQTSTNFSQNDKKTNGSSPFKLFMSPPVLCGLACFLSGTVGSTVLSVVWPTNEEEDDLRSFTSFALGALMCCFLLKKELPTHSKANAQEKFAPAPRPRLAAKQAPVVPTAPVDREERRACAPSSFRGLELPRHVTPPPGLARPFVPLPFEAPPGLDRAAGVAPWRARAAGRPELFSQSLAAPARAAALPDDLPVLPYAPQTFRKEVIAIMKALATHRNVALAVRQVRLRGVPVDRQAAELADILTYALEEVRGTVRRLHVAFVGGLAGAFEKNAYVAGVKLFFDGIYVDLCEEVQKLPKLVKIELVPTLRSVLSADEVIACVPDSIDA